MTASQFEQKVDELLSETVIPYLKGRCNVLFQSGGVDPADFGNDFALPKIIVYVALQDTASSIRPLSDGYDEIAENLKHF